LEALAKSSALSLEALRHTHGSTPSLLLSNGLRIDGGDRLLLDLLSGLRLVPDLLVVVGDLVAGNRRLSNARFLDSRLLGVSSDIGVGLLVVARHTSEISLMKPTV